MLGSTLQGEAQGGRSPWAFPFGKTQGSLPGRPSEASPCRVSNQFGSTGGVCNAWLPPATVLARMGLRNAAKIWGLCVDSRVVNVLRTSSSGLRTTGPCIPKYHESPRSLAAQRVLKCSRWTFFGTMCRLRKCPRGCGEGLGLPFCLVVFMRRLHQSVDWTQYGRQVMPLASGYPLDGLWAHGAGDHATRSAPACRLLASAGRNGRSASPAITDTLLSLPPGFPAIANW